MVFQIRGMMNPVRIQINPTPTYAGKYTTRLNLKLVLKMKSNQQILAPNIGYGKQHTAVSHAPRKGTISNVKHSVTNHPIDLCRPAVH